VIWVDTDGGRLLRQEGQMFLQLVLPQHLSTEVSTTTNTAYMVSLPCVHLEVVVVFSREAFRELLSTVLALVDHIFFLCV